MMTGRMNEKDGDAEILKAFKLFVPEDGGKIGLEQLRRVATEVRRPRIALGAHLTHTAWRDPHQRRGSATDDRRGGSGRRRRGESGRVSEGDEGTARLSECTNGSGRLSTGVSVMSFVYKKKTQQ